jgi:pyruvate dehydrogenase E2 component (dihydrolipoamide acetyltransferase)
MTLRMERALDFMERFRVRTGKRLTVTHMVAKAASIALQRMPEANAMIRLWRIYPRKSVSVFLQVALEDPDTGKPDLSGTIVHGVDRMSLEEIVDAVERNVATVRARKDRAMEKSRSTFSRVPGFAIHFILRTMSSLLYGLNLDLSRLGLPKDGFGSIMITNIGSLGLDEAYVPLVPWSRTPLLIAVGKVADEPVVESGVVVPARTMKLCATFDHRLIDGAHAAVLAKAIREVFSDPDKAFGPPPAVSG